MRTPMRRRDRRVERQQEAIERNEARNQRSAQEQLVMLDKRGCVASKERDKLMRQLETA